MSPITTPKRLATVLSTAVLLTGLVTASAQARPRRISTALPPRQHDPRRQRTPQRRPPRCCPATGGCLFNARRDRRNAGGPFGG
jgi:hypothetical protein